jgi:hypothetical protein
VGDSGHSYILGWLAPELPQLCSEEGQPVAVE